MGGVPETMDNTSKKGNVQTDVQGKGMHSHAQRERSPGDGRRLPTHTNGRGASTGRERVMYKGSRN